jgi:hypothetical protein
MYGLFSIQNSRSLDRGPIWARVISEDSRTLKLCVCVCVCITNPERAFALFACVGRGKALGFVNGDSDNGYGCDSDNIYPNTACMIQHTGACASFVHGTR